MSLLPLWVILIFFLGSSFAQRKYAKELCVNGKGKFDTIFSTTDDKVYIIKADKYWELEGDKDNGFSLTGYAKKVQHKWPGLPASLDTAFTNYIEGKTYFLKGNQMWVYDGQKLMAGYPKLLASKFPGVPGDLDGAFVCTGYNYFFKGDKYYGANHNSGSISAKWNGLPNNMHAAVQFSSRGHTFFFKDHQFYKFRVWNGPVEPGYPKDVVPFWFQCDGDGDGDGDGGNDDYTDLDLGENETGSINPRIRIP